MFKQLQNIESAFRHIRLFSFLFLCANLILSGFVIYDANLKLNQARAKVFVLSNGKLLEAISVDRKEKLPVEIRDHVNNFHQLFFSLEPDEQLIKDQLIKALYLCDNSARIQYNDLTSTGYYSGIVAGSISQRVNMDSIIVDIDRAPWFVRYYGKISIISPTSIVVRSLITEGDVRDLSAISDNNPHGFLIEHWRIVENKDLKVQPR